MVGKSTKERLIDACIEVAAVHGVEGVTVRKLSDYMGFSEAALYRHYQGRDDVLIKTFLRLDAEVSELYQKMVHDNSDIGAFDSEGYITWRTVLEYLVENEKKTWFLLRFRYSNLYTLEVRGMRKAYTGYLTNSIEDIESYNKTPGEFYKEFSLNYMFEMTLSFAEKIISGRVKNDESTKEIMWKMIIGAMKGMSAGVAAKAV